MKTLLSVLCSISLIFPQFASAQTIFKDFDNRPAEFTTQLSPDKWTVVMIWAYDCLVCNEEAHAYEAFHQRSKNTSARVLGVSVDGKKHQKEAKAFIKRHKLNFPNLIGEFDAVADWFYQNTGAQWRGTPSFLIYNPSGELVAQQAGAIPVPLLEQFIAKGGF